MGSPAASAHIQGSDSPSHEFSQARHMHKKALFYFECDSLEGLRSEGSRQYSEGTHSLTLRSVSGIPGLLCLLLHLSRSWPQTMAPEQGAGFELQQRTEAGSQRAGLPGVCRGCERPT